MYQTSMVRALNPLSLFSTGRDDLTPAPAQPKQRQSNPSHQATRSHRRPHEAPQENPSPGTWLLIAGATAAAVGIGVALFAKRGGAPTTGGGGEQPGGGGGEQPGGGGGGGGGGGTKKCNYLGCGPSYQWPHMDRFPNRLSIGQRLAEMGYTTDWAGNPNGWMVTQQGKNAIAGFQSEYNIVRKNAPGWDFIPANAPSAGSADGFAGDATINALYNADKWLLLANMTWPDMVDLAKSTVA